MWLFYGHLMLFGVLTLKNRFGASTRDETGRGIQVSWSKSMR